MPVASMVIDEVGLYADGAPFGDVGPYELVRGRARVEIDPFLPGNSAVTDLTRAQRNTAGMVECESDVLVLRPVSAVQGNSSVLTVMPNRGGVGPLPFSFGLSAAEKAEWLGRGDSFLLRNGWTIVWIGWQWDIARNGMLLGCTVPEALDEQGQPISGWTSISIEPTKQLRYHPLNELTIGWTHDAPVFADGVYRTIDIGDPAASLTITEPGNGSRTLPRNQWRFARDEGDGPEDSEGHIWVQGGFQPGLRYDLHFQTQTCPVVGIGLLAVRDIAAFLRHGSPSAHNPLAHHKDAKFFAFGVSQSGRFLLEYLRTIDNADGRGGPAFDAVLPFLAGSNRGQFNQRYGKPGALPGVDLGELPPHGVNGTDGILAKQSPQGRSPRVILVNSGTEYWRGDAGHAHLSTDGTRDLPDDPEVRIYSLAGTDHTNGAAGRVAGQTMPSNRVDPTLAWRAILNAARNWIHNNTPPPPNRCPRVADGSAVPRERVLARFASFPHVPLTPNQLAQRCEYDLGPQAAQGVVRLPVKIGKPYTVLVSDVDDSLNEVAGIRLPEIQYPIAVHTPWSSPDDFGTAHVLARFFGYSIPLPEGEAAGSRNGLRAPAAADAHPKSRLTGVRKAAAQLVQEGFLLPDDEEAAIAQAMGTSTREPDDTTAWVPSASAVARPSRTSD